jgi:hypothetical protein
MVYRNIPPHLEVTDDDDLSTATLRVETLQTEAGDAFEQALVDGRPALVDSVVSHAAKTTAIPTREQSWNNASTCGI